MRHFRLHHASTTKPTSKTFAVYLGVLFVSFHYFTFVFINSSFLAQYLNDSWIGYVYIIGSLLNIFLLINAHKFLRKYGNLKLLITLVIAEIITLLTLAHTTSTSVVIIAFIIQHAINPVIIYCLDIILDTYTTQSEQGQKRGLFLTILNTPPIIASVITGFILTGNNFEDIYTIAAVFLIPVLLIAFFNFRKFTDPHYKKVEIVNVLSRLKSHKSVRNILIDNVVLQTFYAIVTIYLPLYLQRVIGFSLSEITIMFSIILIPFVILQLPIGKIADERIGEKEFLIGGFILMGISISIIGWISTDSFLVWTLILLATRIGAAIVEISTESYFFKHVHSTDADMIGVFRMSHATAFIITPLIGAIIVMYVNIQEIFLIGASMILIVGLRYAFDLRDTK